MTPAEHQSARSIERIEKSHALIRANGANDRRPTSSPMNINSDTIPTRRETGTPGVPVETDEPVLQSQSPPRPPRSTATIWMIEEPLKHKMSTAVRAAMVARARSGHSVRAIPRRPGRQLRPRRASIRGAISERTCERPRAEGKRRHQDGGWKSKAKPRRQSTWIAGTNQSQRKHDLTAGGSGQKLAKRSSRCKRRHRSNGA